ncbi:hypothetical protein B9479_005959 [Cryptococcus floricola]|uniref:Peroxin-14 n=1 Tax=Cryptococcus floricola TaxID=2591691 RepID=A0A5D3ARI8_9TREE|nr:hypothetical protein B9479_005959 [Cryptococcus floricola]
MSPRAAHTPPRTLPEFLRRLSQLLAIVLGVSSAGSAIWSLFILPLLHASFSARKALVDQQNDRAINIARALSRIRSLSIYGQPSPADTPAEGGEEKQADGPLENTSDASLQEIHSSAASESSLTPDSGGTPGQAVFPLSNLSTLSSSLSRLTSALESTSTTRTSLISNLESYSSHLHRQLFAARPVGSKGFGGYAVGMGSLDAHLRNEGEAESRGEEWDAVRKDIRAIKGMLLNRRTSTPIASANRS